jgi:hypothetical protein
MRLTLKTSALVLLLLPALAPSRADALKDARAGIGAAYKKLEKAYVKKDISVLDQLFSPDCRFKMKGEGFVPTRKHVVEGTRGMLRAFEVTSSRIEVKEFRAAKVEAGQFVAVSTWTLESRPLRAPQGASEGKSRPKPARLQQTLTDTWQKTDNGWQIVSRLIDG